MKRGKRICEAIIISNLQFEIYNLQFRIYNLSIINYPL